MPDLLLVNARLAGTPVTPGVTHDAIAVRDSRIAAIGDSAEMLAAAPEDVTVLDADGRLVVPGFVDAHTHWGLCAQSESRAADCRTAESVEDILRVGREQAARTPAGEWVFLQGASFQDGRVREGRFPTGAELDAISTEHPIIYKSQLHHVVVNSPALRLAGITRDTPDPPGSHIDRDPDTGEPTGELHDMWAMLPLPADDSRLTEAAMKRVGWDHFLSQGVTTLLEIVDSPQIMAMQRRLVADGEVPLRVRAVPWLPKAATIDEALEWAQPSNDSMWIDDWFEYDGIKLFSDGGTSVCTAAFHEDYVGQPGNRGSLVYTDEELRGLLTAIHGQGLQALVHAAGDRAQDQVVEAFGDIGDRSVVRGARHRIEHMGNVGWSEGRARACEAVGVLPMPNLGFTYHFGEYWPRVLGSKVETEEIPLRTMLRRGFPLAGTSDTTGPDLVILHPLHNILTATLRQTYAGRVVNPSEWIPPSSGLDMYTRGSAYSCRIEATRGTLEVGKLADMAVIDGWAGDTDDEDTLRDLAVAHTIVGGDVVWSREGTT